MEGDKAAEATSAAAPEEMGNVKSLLDRLEPKKEEESSGGSNNVVFCLLCV